MRYISPSVKSSDSASRTPRGEGSLEDAGVPDLRNVRLGRSCVFGYMTGRGIVDEHHAGTLGVLVLLKMCCFRSVEERKMEQGVRQK